MLSRQFELWPCHPHPLPDELLSSWLVRIAHAHHLKVQTFCDLVFGKERQIWNRDIDRLAPRWVINRLSIQTGTSLAATHQTALTTYRGLLYPRKKDSGILRWILPLDMWHRKRRGFGLQFCPECLARDEVPYYRKRWRVALYTFCTEHNVLLHDRCPECGAGVAFHRIEMGRYGSADESPLSFCHVCGFDLRMAPRKSPALYEQSIEDTMIGVLRMLEEKQSEKWLDEGYFSVLHHMCRMLLMESNHVRLRDYVIKEIFALDLPVQSGLRELEERTLTERHHIVQLGMWLMVDPACRVVDAWRVKAVRYNVLKRDFKHMPDWYHTIIGQCSCWRDL